MGEIVIIAIILAIFLVLLVGLKRDGFDHVQYNERILRTFGIRNLTFQRKSDVLIAIGLVGTFLAAILLMSPK